MTQPVGGTSGGPLVSQPVVAVQDASGATITTDSATQVAVAIESGTGGTLGGTLTVSASNGVAAFGDLTLTGVTGQTYVLRFTAPGLTGANAAGITVSPAVVPDRYIVTYRAGVNPLAEALSARATGATPVRGNAALRTQVVTVTRGSGAAVLNALRANPRVQSVTLDKARSLAGTSNDPGYAQQWALPKIGWDQVYGSVTPIGSAVVAVLDTGVDAMHPDLVSNLVLGTSILDGSTGGTDPNGHGTSMAGIIAAQTNNAVGIAGVGFAGVKVMPVTVLGADGVGYDSDIMRWHYLCGGPRRERHPHGVQQLRLLG